MGQKDLSLLLAEMALQEFGKQKKEGSNQYNTIANLLDHSDCVSCA